MNVILNTDQPADNFDALSTHVTAVVSEALMHYRDHITRVEVHLGDENGAKPGPGDKRCMMKARVDGRSPIAVTHHAETVDAAVHGAARSLAKAIESVIGREASVHASRARSGGG